MTTYSPENLNRWTRPACYAGAEWPDYFGAGFGQSRDSDCLEQSNFAAALAALKALPPFVHSAPDCDNETESRFIVRESHWAVGWVEWIAVHEADEAALRLCDSIRAKADNYPVLNDEDFSERETEAANDVWRDCYNVRERVAYIRKHKSQFEFRSLRDALSCVRGNYFAGYASELIS